MVGYYHIVYRGVEKCVVYKEYEEVLGSGDKDN